MDNQSPLQEGQLYGLVVSQPGKVQRILLKYIVMILNYRYGFEIIMAKDLTEGAKFLRQHHSQIRGVFVVHKEKIQNKMILYAMSLQGKLPVFVLCPIMFYKDTINNCTEMDTVHVCAWERAFQKSKQSLGTLVTTHLKEGDLAQVMEGAGGPEHQNLQTQVEHRVKNLQTLPAIPEIVLRIMRMINDPNTNAEALEQVLLNDPSIVQKLLQVINSPVFAGVAHTGNWTLKEAIVRMGLKKAGAIAQQVKLMNTFVKPEESSFDLQRFWEHSIGCAMLADKLCTDQLIPAVGEVTFDMYWISSILHDIGKMVQGFFFWEHFEEVLKKMSAGKDGAMLSFRQAEAELDDSANHEYIGELLLMKSNVPATLLQAISSHHTVNESSDKLHCLTHLVNNLIKDLGMGYVPNEKGVYSEALLKVLEIEEADIEQFRDMLGEQVAGQIKELVELCLST